MLAWSGAGDVQLAPTALALALVMPFLLLWHFARSFSIAHLNLRQALVLDVATAAIQITAVGWFAWRGHLNSAAGYVALGIGSGCTSLLWLIASRRKLRIRRSRLIIDCRKNLRFGRWVLAGQLTGTLHGYLPAWILAFAVGTAATGVFSACESIVLLSNPLILAIANLYARRA